MTQQPPVPEANRSPFPIEEPPHEHIELPPVAETEGADETESIVPSLGTSAILGIGAVAVGVVATAATFFFTRDKPAKRTSAKAKTKSKPKAKPAARRTRKAA